MPPKTRGENKRSKSCGRLPSRELQTTDMNSHSPSLETSASESQVRVGRLPKQNTEEVSTSSNLPKLPKATTKIDLIHDISSSESNVNDDNEIRAVSPNSTGINKDSHDEQVSDNTGNPLEGMPARGENTGTPPKDDPPPQPWDLVLQEIKEIRQRVAVLDKIERSTETHTQQLSGIVQRTSDLESAMEAASEQIKSLSDEVSTLKGVVKTQGETITTLTNRKNDLSKQTAETVAEMNKLVQTQKDQINSFHESSRDLKHEIRAEVDQKIEKLSDEVNHCSLKSQANANKLNLVITGLQEDPDKTSLALAKDFFVSTLKIKGLQLDVAYRIGNAQAEDSSYIRPLVVRFDNAASRDKVWKNKIDITDDSGKKIRIQTDLPKRLRDESQLLHRVVKAAVKIPKYKTAKIKDYKLLLNGEEYTPSQLEQLPEPIRPSTLASPKSDTTIAFFSRHSVFSNHYHSSFTIKGAKFNNMEQYLAYRKAQLANQDHLASQALHAKDPAEAKAILNKLKNKCTKEWKEQAPKIAEEGIREKFRQNQYLLDILISTRGFKLGEASRDSFWGIGMTLTDPNVLDQAKWLPKGNLLGRTLMKIREEFRSQASPLGSPSKHRTKLSKK